MQVTEHTDGPCEHDPQTKEADLTGDTVADDGKPDRINDITDDVGVQAGVSSQGSGQAVADESGIQTYTGEHLPPGLQKGKGGHNRQGFQTAQLPFVTYKATEKG